MKNVIWLGIIFWAFFSLGLTSCRDVQNERSHSSYSWEQRDKSVLQEENEFDQFLLSSFPMGHKIHPQSAAFHKENFGRELIVKLADEQDQSKNDLGIYAVQKAVLASAPEDQNWKKGIKKIYLYLGRLEDFAGKIYLVKVNEARLVHEYGQFGLAADGLVAFLGHEGTSLPKRGKDGSVEALNSPVMPEPEGSLYNPIFYAEPGDAPGEDMYAKPKGLDLIADIPYAGLHEFLKESGEIGPLENKQPDPYYFRLFLEEKRQFSFGTTLAIMKRLPEFFLLKFEEVSMNEEYLTEKLGEAWGKEAEMRAPLGSNSCVMGNQQYAAYQSNTTSSLAQAKMIELNTLGQNELRPLLQGSEERIGEALKALARPADLNAAGQEQEAQEASEKAQRIFKNLWKDLQEYEKNLTKLGIEGLTDQIRDDHTQVMMTMCEQDTEYPEDNMDTGYEDPDPSSPEMDISEPEAEVDESPDDSVAPGDDQAEAPIEDTKPKEEDPVAQPQPENPVDDNDEEHNVTLPITEREMECYDRYDQCTSHNELNRDMCHRNSAPDLHGECDPNSLTGCQEPGDPFDMMAQCDVAYEEGDENCNQMKDMCLNQDDMHQIY